MVFPPKEGELSTLLLGERDRTDAHRIYVSSHGACARRTKKRATGAPGGPETTTFGVSTKGGGIDTVEALKLDPYAPALTVEQSINPLKSDACRGVVTGVVVVDERRRAGRRRAGNRTARDGDRGGPRGGARRFLADARRERRARVGRRARNARGVLGGGPGARSEHRQIHDEAGIQIRARPPARAGRRPRVRRPLDAAGPRASEPAVRRGRDRVRRRSHSRGAGRPGYGAERGVVERLRRAFGEAVRRFYEDAGVLDPDADDGGSSPRSRRRRRRTRRAGRWQTGTPRRWGPRGRGCA